MLNKYLNIFFTHLLIYVFQITSETEMFLHSQLNGVEVNQKDNEENVLDFAKELQNSLNLRHEDKKNRRSEDKDIKKEFDGTVKKFSVPSRSAKGNSAYLYA